MLPGHTPDCHTARDRRGRSAHRRIGSQRSPGNCNYSDRQWPEHGQAHLCGRGHRLRCRDVSGRRVARPGLFLGDTPVLVSASSLPSPLPRRRSPWPPWPRSPSGGRHRRRGQHPADQPGQPVPMAGTPNIGDGSVQAFAQVGSKVIVGGNFTSATPSGSTTARDPDVPAGGGRDHRRAGHRVRADAGRQRQRAAARARRPDTVYVGGAFNNVNGTKFKGIALLDTTTGALVPGFKFPPMNGVVNDHRAGRRPAVRSAARSPRSAPNSRPGLGSLNPTTGAVDALPDHRGGRAPQLPALRRDRERRSAHRRRWASPSSTSRPTAAAWSLIGNFTHRRRPRPRPGRDGRT